jgi:DNA-directed RNA polymerase subunit N (RpoN/RPB10)
MLYARCPSCGLKLADKEVAYEKGLLMICDNPKLSDDERDKQKRILVNSLGLKRWCCKQRALTYIDLIKIVK